MDSDQLDLWLLKINPEVRFNTAREDDDPSLSNFKIKTESAK